MKQNKIRILYFSLISLLFLFFIYSCQKDDSSDMIESSDEIQKIISKDLSFQDIPHFNTVSTVISKLTTDLNNKGIGLQKTIDVDSVTISTDDILYMTYEETHTYTFKLTRNNPEYYIENIVLHYNVDTGNYDEYLVQYDVTVQEYLDISNGSDLSEQSNVIITELDNGTASAILAKSCSRSCQTIYVQCTAGGNHWPGENCSGDPNQVAYTYTECTTTCTEPEDETIDDGDSSGGGGGNGDVVTKPKPKEPCETNGQTGITGNDGCTTFENPCENINSLIANTDIKNKIQSLKTPETLNLNYEKGFIMKTDNTGSLSATPKSGSPNNVTMPIPLSDNGQEPDGSVSGFIHTHYNGLLPSFSIEDIKALNGVYQWRKFKGKPLKDMTAIVVTQSGVFALVINDVSTFETEGFKLHTPEFLEIKDKTDDLLEKETGSNIQRSIRNLIDKVLPTYGLDLYKASDDLTSWNKVEPNPNNASDTNTTPCN